MQQGLCAPRVTSAFSRPVESQMELSEFPHFPEKSPFSTGLGISSGFFGVLLFSPSTWKIKEIHYHEQITDVCTTAAWLPACGWQRQAWAHGQATGQVALGMLRDISPCLGCHLPALGKPCHLCASVSMSKKRITELHLIKMMFHRSHQAPRKRCSVQTAVVGPTTAGGASPPNGRKIHKYQTS